MQAGSVCPMSCRQLVSRPPRRALLTLTGGLDTSTLFYVVGQTQGDARCLCAASLRWACHQGEPTTRMLRNALQQRGKT